MKEEEEHAKVMVVFLISCLGEVKECDFRATAGSLNSNTKSRADTLHTQTLNSTNSQLITHSNSSTLTRNPKPALFHDEMLLYFLIMVRAQKMTLQTHKAAISDY